MSSRVHLVLGGGGALGAFQAGALVGLLDAGLVPDALYGCSAGALNAAFLASRPEASRAHELAAWWQRAAAAQLLAPGWRSHARGLRAVLRARGMGLLDSAPLRQVVLDNVPAHDLSELRVPLTVTTTCLDCGLARHHDRGAVGDLLVASCSLPGLFPPVLLADGHRHVDGGVLHGVPVAPALAAAGPDDVVLVLDCGLDPVTGPAGTCAATGPGSACGLDLRPGQAPYAAPVERSVGALDVVLQSFTVSRSAANRESVRTALQDPRVRVLPHVADAWAAGFLDRLPAGPRDTSQAGRLVRAGELSAQAWLRSGGTAQRRWDSADTTG
jgi:predicted acylesterase/phospholipase RssA